jgi:hypothetical protein
MRQYGALVLLFCTTVEAGDRPWWEADIAAEMAVLEAQNTAIQQQIEAELAGFSDAELRALESEAEAYLREAERSFLNRDEARIRSEIERLNAAARPYFDGDRYLLEPNALFTDRNKR